MRHLAANISSLKVRELHDHFYGENGLCCELCVKSLNWSRGHLQLRQQSHSNLIFEWQTCNLIYDIVVRTKNQIWGKWSIVFGTNFVIIEWIFFLSFQANFSFTKPIPRFSKSFAYSILILYIKDWIVTGNIKTGLNTRRLIKYLCFLNILSQRPINQSLITGLKKLPFAEYRFLDSVYVLCGYPVYVVSASLGRTHLYRYYMIFFVIFDRFTCHRLIQIV